MTPKGYVIMEGSIDEEGKVRDSKIVESFPDHAQDRLAQAFGQRAEIHTPTVGSRIAPRASVYVIFYDHLLEGSIAVVFAKRLDSAGTGHFGEGDYLNAFTF